MRHRILVLIGLLFLPLGALAEGWSFLPEHPHFQALVADPRETRGAILVNLKGNRLDGAIGKVLPLLRHEGKRGVREWGIHACAFPYLQQQDLRFPMQANDWYLGTYLSGGERLRWRLDYTHVSAHLGDALFAQVAPIVYSREFFRFIASVRRGPLRLYVGPGFVGHSIPKEPSFFIQTGAEWTSRPLGRSGHLYAAWDLKVKREAGGVANHALQGGWQFGDAETGRTLRFGLAYFHGNSENGQFYRSKEDRLSLGVFFDP